VASSNIDLRVTIRRRVVASLVAGAAFGLGARVVMRFIARASGTAGAFSWGGSLEVVLFGAMIGAPVALCFFLLRDRVPVPPPWPGLVIGVALFAVLAMRPPGSAQSAILATNDPPLLTAGLFLALCLLFGAGLEWVWSRTRGRNDDA
jgi:hypothetical protein